jgi:FKBP-type peptidyl-prolyl cis-trans isomerase SlyD
MSASQQDYLLPIEPQRRVTIEYVLSTEDEILESTEKTGSLTFTVGDGSLHPAIESALLGLRTDEAFSRHIDASLAFGAFDDQLRFRLSRRRLPPALVAATVGVAFEAPGPDGKLRLFRIVEASEESVLIDGNHPLAGETLHFEGKVLRVEE